MHYRVLAVGVYGVVANSHLRQSSQCAAGYAVFKYTSKLSHELGPYIRPEAWLVPICLHERSTCKDGVTQCGYRRIGGACVLIIWSSQEAKKLTLHIHLPSWTGRQAGPSRHAHRGGQKAAVECHVPPADGPMVPGRREQVGERRFEVGLYRLAVEKYSYSQ